MKSAAGSIDYSIWSYCVRCEIKMGKTKFCPNCGMLVRNVGRTKHWKKEYKRY